MSAAEVAPGRVAVLGAGVAGLTAAHRLAGRGHAVDVYERWPGLGGQAATLDVGDGVLLERYYHHLFTSDRHIAALYDELGMPDGIEWHPSSLGMFAAGRLWGFTSPLDLLRFRPLPLHARLRMGAVVMALQRRADDVGPYETVTAREWVERRMGPAAWSAVWEPMLRGKFGARADEISMGWLWSKLTLRRQVRGKEARREVLGYPRDSWEPLFAALQASIERNGGRVLIDRPAARVAPDGERFRVTPGAEGSFRRGHDPSRFEPGGDPERYDAVLSTLPSDVFLQVLDEPLRDGLAAGYEDRLRSIPYQTALCLLLEVDGAGGPMTPYYWLNVADRDVPFIGLVEQANLVGTDRYAGRRFLYVANYVEPDDPLLALDPDALLEVYLPGLRRIAPGFGTERVRARWLFREPAAQPVVTVGYRDRMPPLRTGVPNLVLANTTQVYPEDRGTNYAVRLGDEAAEVVAADLGSGSRATAAPVAG